MNNKIDRGHETARQKTELREGERRTLATNLRHELEGEIFRGQLAPGTRLDEQEIARRFGVSRTPVREALQALASSGMVEMRPRQGATVALLTVSSLIEIFQVMAELEGLCAQLAARRMDRDRCASMTREHEDMIRIVDSNGDPSEFYEANKRFHEIIYQGSQNTFLIDQMRVLRTRVASYRRYITFQPGRMQTSIGEHEAVVKAIVDRDVEGAQTQMRKHVNLLGDDLSDFIASLPSHLLRTG